MISRAQKNLGSVYEIELPDGRHAYAQALRNPLYAFFDVISETHLDIGDVLSKALLFRIWIHNLAPKDGKWKKIGTSEPLAEQLVSPWFRKQDIISGAITVYRSRPDLDDGYEEHPSTYEEAAALEPAAVWEAEHIRDRLGDHFSGKPNKWVESLKLSRQENRKRGEVSLGTQR